MLFSLTITGCKNSDQEKIDKENERQKKIICSSTVNGEPFKSELCNDIKK